MKKNILILSASFGTGHDQAAKAIQEALSAQSWVKEVAVVDFFGAKSSRFSSAVKKTYFQMLQHYPDFYDFLYLFIQLPRWDLMTQNVSGLPAPHRCDSSTNSSAVNRFFGASSLGI